MAIGQGFGSERWLGNSSIDYATNARPFLGTVGNIGQNVNSTMNEATVLLLRHNRNEIVIAAMHF
jgi:hypothetical protein